MLIDKEKIQKAKAKIGDKTASLIAEILGVDQYDESKQRGLCPFHKEDTPSFIYFPKSFSFHCFGCGKNVDIIDAYMSNGDTYAVAVQKMFEKANIKYTLSEHLMKDKRDYRYPTEPQRDNTDIAYAYLQKRGISTETARIADVRQDERGNIAFLYYDTNDVLKMVKYRPSHKVSKESGELKSWCQQGADTQPLLFNMNRINTTEPLIITEGECFQGDVEILTETGWMRFDCYDDRRVLAVDENLNARFVNPIAVIRKIYKGSLVNWHNGKNGGINITATPKHNIVYSLHGKLHKRHIEDMPTSLGGVIPVAVNLDRKGINLTYTQIALYLTIVQDCLIDEYNECRVCYKDISRSNRLRILLTRLNINFGFSRNRDTYYIHFHVPDFVLASEGEAVLPYKWATDATLEQRKFIVEELRYRNDHESNKFCCEFNLKENADVLQTVAATAGCYTRVKSSCGKYNLSVDTSRNTRPWSKQEKYDIQYDGKVYCVTVDTGMILIRIDGLIYVVGNCDCLSLLQSGIHNAVSVPLGAQNLHWIEENWDWLEQFEEIVFCGDNDEPGIKMVKEASSRLGSWRCKIAALPDVAEVNGEERRIKDANECLYFLGEQALRDAIANAKDTPVASAIDFSDVEDINLGDIDGVQFGIKDLDRGLMRLFFGTFNIVSGTPGSGKTSFLYQMVCNTIDSGVNCWVYSRELMSWMSRNWFMSILASPYNAVQCENSNSDNYYIVPQDIKKDISDYYRGRITLYRDDYDNDFETIIGSMINCRRKYGCKLFIIDNLMTVDLKGDDNNKNERQTMFCNRLIQFAIKYDCCVVLVAHPRKMLDPNASVGLYDVAGTSNIQNLAHRTIALRRVSDEEKCGIPSKNGNGWQKPPNPYNAMITVVKDRMRGKAGLQVGVYYDIKSRRFYTNKEEYFYKYDWQKRSNICLNPNIKYPPSEEEEKAFGEVNNE